jgi:hypothetical protein
LWDCELNRPKTGSKYSILRSDGWKLQVQYLQRIFRISVNNNTCSEHTLSLSSFSCLVRVFQMFLDYSPLNVFLWLPTGTLNKIF